MRLNQARTEAELEIKQFKIELEQQMKDTAAADKTGAGADMVAIETKTKSDIASQNASVLSNTQSVSF